METSRLVNIVKLFEEVSEQLDYLLSHIGSIRKTWVTKLKSSPSAAVPSMTKAIHVGSS
jgi:hypothetical protein